MVPVRVQATYNPHEWRIGSNTCIWPKRSTPGFAGTSDVGGGENDDTSNKPPQPYLHTRWLCSRGQFQIDEASLGSEHETNGLLFTISLQSLAMFLSWRALIEKKWLAGFFHAFTIELKRKTIGVASSTDSTCLITMWYNAKIPIGLFSFWLLPHDLCDFTAIKTRPFLQTYVLLHGVGGFFCLVFIRNSWVSEMIFHSQCPNGWGLRKTDKLLAVLYICLWCHFFRRRWLPPARNRSCSVENRIAR